MSIVFCCGENTNSINGRELHNYMKVKTDFSDWIKRRINGLGAEENVDFVVLKNGDGKFAKIDYILTDDFAKHLGMVEKNEKGRQVRDYFIYMEKLARYLVAKKIEECNIKSEIAHNEIKQLQVKRLKTYSHGFMSLRKYLKDNDINLTEETAWSMLLQCNAVEKRDTLVSKTFLLDDTFGKQIGDSVIEFNSRALDNVFSNYVNVEPSLFEEG